jgi:carbamoyltransferase
VGPSDSQRGSFLGPAYTNAEVCAALDKAGAVYQVIDDEGKLCDRIAELLAEQNVVGHVAGRMEFGPRALGGRSILGDARSPEMQSVMNLKIKFRESFRPFAPAVLAERVADYFEMRPDQESPYMLLVAPVRQEHRIPSQGNAKGIELLKQPRSTIPAITHVDHSARVQTVDAERNPRFHGILSCFEERTGCPVLINTSFNVRGEPIVCTPADAYRCFMATHMDVLVVENCLLLKREQPDAGQFDRDAYLAEFALD